MNYDTLIYNYGSVDVKFKNKVTINVILLILSIILFTVFFQIGDTIDKQMYPGVLVLELMLFMYVNDYKLININVAFLGCLMVYFLCGPIVYMLTKRTIEYNLFVINIGVFAYIIGIYCKKNIRLNKHTYNFSRKINGIFDSKVGPIFLYMISCLASLYYLFINRSVLYSNLETGRVEAMSGNGLILLLIKCFIVSVPMLYSEYKKRKIDGLFFYLMLFVSIILTFVIGYKASSLTICIVVALMYCRYEELPIKKIVKILIFCVILIIFLDFVRAFLSSTKFSLLTKIENNMVVGFYNYERILYWFPKNTSFQYGYTFILNFKMLLPGPDLDFTLWLKETLNMNFSGGGTVPTIFGELYINFSYVGIYLGMFIIGILSEKVSNMYKKSGYKWYISLIAWQFVHSVTGGFSNTIVDTLLLLIIGLIVSFIEKKPERMRYFA